MNRVSRAADPDSYDPVSRSDNSAQSLMRCSLMKSACMFSLPKHSLRLFFWRLVAALTAGLLLLPTSAQAAKTGRSPAAIVTALYEATKNNAVSAAFGLDPEDRKLMSKSLAALWAQSDAHDRDVGNEIGAVDFDVVSMSQDPNIGAYVIRTERQDARRATVVATFTIGPQNVRTGQKETVYFDFVREDGAWKIDEIRASIKGVPWSLRATIEYNLAH
jgi:hypothetical protein